MSSLFRKLWNGRSLALSPLVRLTNGAGGCVNHHGSVRSIGHGLKKTVITNRNKKSTKLTPEEIEQMTGVDMELKHYMHGRKNRERLDSVTPTILAERAKHQARLVAFVNGDSNEFIHAAVASDNNNGNINNNSSDDHISSSSSSSSSDSYRSDNDDDENENEHEHDSDLYIHQEHKDEDETLKTSLLTSPPLVESVVRPSTTRTLRQEMTALSELGFGQGKQRLSGVYKDLTYWTAQRKTGTAAGGFAQFQGSAVKAPWPLFRHLLPELAFTGHSNSGKSTLVNAMIGVRPNSQGGLAKAHERAGWTDEVYFYALGKRPPVLTLADLPGYGHAVASPIDIKRWKILSRSYLSQRLVLSRCFVLVDCTRGLCRDDHQMLRFLSKYKVPWQVILTKGDLLPLNQLAACRMLTSHELSTTYFADKPERAPEVGVISCNTGAGVQALWRSMSDIARRHSRGPPGHDDDPDSTAVREHRLANRMRNQHMAK